MFSLFSWKRSEISFVAVVMLAILGISQIQLRVSQMKARDAQRKADVELVARALNRYSEVYEIYPASSQGRIVSCGDILDLPCEWGQGSIRDEKGVVYLTRLPQDPLASRDRRYIYEVDNQRRRYRIYVTLENCRDEVQCNWFVGNY